MGIFTGIAGFVLLIVLCYATLRCGKTVLRMVGGLFDNFESRLGL